MFSAAGGSTTWTRVMSSPTADEREHGFHVHGRSLPLLPGTPLNHNYSDRVVLDANLQHRATALSIQRIWGQIFFHPLYLHLKPISTLQDLIFSFCCIVTRHLRVGQNFSDVNDAELPNLEGTVTLDRHKCHTSYTRFATIAFARAIMHQPSTPPVLFTPLLAACAHSEPIPPNCPYRFSITITAKYKVYGKTFQRVG